MAKDEDSFSADTQAIMGGRLRRLLERYSQAELARLARTSTANISRYLSGTRMPADICMALVKNANVSPSWLLAGEGPPFVDQAHSNTMRTAEELLELVQAMNTVQRRKFGSLAGKPHQRTLQELSSALVSYQELRERTSRELRPMYERLVDDFHAAVEEDDVERAEALGHAVNRIASLCDDEQLSLKLANAHCDLEHMKHNHARVLSLRREIFWRELAAFSTDPDMRLHAINNYINALFGSGYLAEASRVYRAALILAEEDEDRMGYQLLRHFGSLVECALGNIDVAMPLSLDSYRRLDSARRESHGASHFHLMALGGAMPIELYLALDPAKDHKFTPWSAINYACGALLVACMCFDQATLSRALERHGPMAQRLPQAFVALFANEMRAAMNGESDGPVRRFDEDPHVMAARASHDPVSPIRVAVMRCRLLMTASRGDEAVVETAHAQALLDNLPAGIQAGVMLRGYHLANVVRLTDTNSGTAARNREAELSEKSGLDRRDAIVQLRDLVTRGNMLFGLFLPVSQPLAPEGAAAQ